MLPVFGDFAIKPRGGSGHPPVPLIDDCGQRTCATARHERWNNWRLPLVYLEVAALLGWRATETASLREEDLLADGFVRVAPERCKTRRYKYGRLPAHLYADLKACAAGGWTPP